MTMLFIVEQKKTLSFESSSIKTEIYSNGKNLRLLKFVFIYKHAGIKLTSAYITQWVLATPTLIDTWFYEYH